MSIASVRQKAHSLDSKVTETIVAIAADLADDMEETFPGLMSDEETEYKAAAKEAGEAIESKKGSRQSEWIAFALAVPYGMADAVRHYPKTGDSLTRVKLFGLARVLKRACDFDARKKLTERFAKDSAKAPSKGTGRVATIGMGLGIIAKAQTRKPKEIAFRKELAKLCAKHGIKFDL